MEGLARQTRHALWTPSSVKRRLIRARAPHHRSSDQVEGRNKHSQESSLACPARNSQIEILHNHNCHEIFYQIILLFQMVWVHPRLLFRINIL